MRTVAEALRWRARRHPDLPCTWFEGRTRTFAEMDRGSNELAAALIGRGVRPGDHVCILDKNSDAFFELLFALDKCGAIATPINWRLTVPEVATIAGDAEPVLFVAGDSFRDTAAAAGHEPLGFSELPRAPGAADPRLDSEASVCWQLYTSGTTGLPKGAMLSGLNLTALGGAFGFEMPELRQGGRSLVAMPLYHIGGVGWGFVSMMFGSCMVITREVVPPELLAIITEQRIETAFLVPAVLQFMCQLPEAERADLSSLRNIAYGASPITPAVLEAALRTFGCRFTQVYGLTETSGAITSLAFEDHEGEKLLSCGRAFWSSELRIVGPAGEELPAGEVGEIAYRGPGLMAGYWNRPEETSAVIRDGWFHTGDAGFMDGAGFIYIRDRVKDMIVSGGENVYPIEVESVLAEHPAVADVAVFGVPDDRWGEAVKAVVVLRAGSTIGAEDLAGWTSGRLAGFKRPRSIDFTDAIPRNPSGKILKRELRAPYWAGAARQVN